MKLRFALGYVVLGSLGLAAIYDAHSRYKRGYSNVHAQSSGNSPNVLHSVSDQAGSFMPFVSAISNSTSVTNSTQAITAWSNYVNVRSDWSMTASTIQRLALADYSSRTNGSASITPTAVVNAVSAVINAKLATMSSTDVQALGQQMCCEVTPRGNFFVNSYNASYYSVTQSSSGAYQISISQSIIADQLNFYVSAPSSAFNTSGALYPSEAVIVLYSLASADSGYGDPAVSVLKSKISDMTGLDMTNKKLFGPNGYVARRPLNQFLDDAAMNQIFTSLGF